MRGAGTMPSQVDPAVGWFDRFAGTASRTVSRAWFFTACVALVLLWAPSYFLFQSVDTWQLVINTATTIVTFLLVALLQNAQQRSDQATQHKLNAVAAAVAELLRERYQQPAAAGGDARAQIRLIVARRELLAAVGLENRESA